MKTPTTRKGLDAGVRVAQAVAEAKTADEARLKAHKHLRYTVLRAWLAGYSYSALAVLTGRTRVRVATMLAEARSEHPELADRTQNGAH